MLPEAERSDAELLRAVAGGDDDAYGLLWQRHAPAARRLAAQVGRPSNVEDLVSESFARVLRAVKDGGGPEAAFRPYLFNTLRRINIDTGRSYHQRVALTDDDGDLEQVSAASAGDEYSADAEQQAAWRAWESLPEESRLLLWHLVVEEETPATIAPLLGVSPNGVSSRAVRAKERLRQAFLNQHLSAADREECRKVRGELGAYVRDALGQRDRAAVDDHVAGCRRCAAAVAELRDVNGTLRLVIAPLVLGGSVVAAAYAGGGHGAASASASAVGLSRPLRTVRRVRQLSRSRYALAGGAVAASAAVVVAVAATSGTSGPQHRALPPPPTSSAATDSPAASAPAAPGATSRTTPVRPAPTPTRTRPTPTTVAPAVPPVPPASSAAASASTSAAARTSTPARHPPAPVATRTRTSTPNPTRTPTPTPTSKPTSKPETVDRTVPVTFRTGQLAGVITVVLPAGWTVTGSQVNGLLSSHGATATGYRWVIVVGSGLTVALRGPSTPGAVLTGTVRTLLATSSFSIALT